MLLSILLQSSPLKVLVVDNHKSFIDCLTEPSTIIAIAAILVSIIGLYITARYSRKTLEQTIRHNKISVEPLFITSITRVNDYEMEFEIHNTGLGTAIIESFKIVVGDCEYDRFSKHLMNQSFANEVKMSEFIFSEPSSMPSNSNKRIFYYTFESKDDFNMFWELLKKTKLIVIYKTMYLEERKYIEKQIIPDN